MEFSSEGQLTTRNPKLTGSSVNLLKPESRFIQYAHKLGIGELSIQAGTEIYSQELNLYKPTGAFNFSYAYQIC